MYIVYTCSYKLRESGRHECLVTLSKEKPAHPFITKLKLTKFLIRDISREKGSSLKIMVPNFGIQSIS